MQVLTLAVITQQAVEVVLGVRAALLGRMCPLLFLLEEALEAMGWYLPLLALQLSMVQEGVVVVTLIHSVQAGQQGVGTAMGFGQFLAEQEELQAALPLLEALLWLILALVEEAVGGMQLQTFQPQAPARTGR
jgi:hypothetical protein